MNSKISYTFQPNLSQYKSSHSHNGRDFLHTLKIDRLLAMISLDKKVSPAFCRHRLSPSSCFYLSLLHSSRPTLAHNPERESDLRVAIGEVGFSLYHRDLRNTRALQKNPSAPLIRPVSSLPVEHDQSRLPNRQHDTLFHSHRHPRAHEPRCSHSVLPLRRINVGIVTISPDNFLINTRARPFSSLLN